MDEIFLRTRVISRPLWPVLVSGTGHSKQRGPGWPVAISFIVGVFLTLGSCVLFGQDNTEEENHSSRVVVQKVFSRTGKYVIELYGSRDGPGSPDEAYLVETSSKKRVYLARTITSVENAALSDDGRFVVLNFHISSGGWSAAYQRTKRGTYRKLVDDDYVWDQVKAGRVRGLTDADLDGQHGRNPFGGLGLLPDTNELLFSINWRHLIFYSIRERKITSRQRSLLQYAGWRKGGEGVFALRLDELSRNRGVALAVWETRRDVCDVYEPLITFPEKKSLLPVVRNEKEIRLQTEGVELLARKTEKMIPERGSVWEVTISGSGPKYDALQEKLGRIRSAVQLHDREPVEWGTPTSFTAFPE